MCFSQLKRNLQKKKQVEYIWKNDFLKTARRKQTIQLMWINSGYLTSDTAWQQSSGILRYIALTCVKSNKESMENAEN